MFSLYRKGAFQLIYSTSFSDSLSQSKRFCFSISLLSLVVKFIYSISPRFKKRVKFRHTISILNSVAPIFYWESSWVNDPGGFGVSELEILIRQAWKWTYKWPIIEFQVSCRWKESVNVSVMTLIWSGKSLETSC